MAALWPGEFLNIRLLARTEPNVVTVPAGALQRGPDGYYAYVVKPDKKAELGPLKSAGSATALQLLMMA